MDTTKNGKTRKNPMSAFPLIGIKAEDTTRELYVSNVIRVWESATRDELQAGKDWYVSANEIARKIANGNVVMGAGVIAALSANKRWSDNVALAIRAFETGKPSGHVGDAVRKAERIMRGESPEAVLPMDVKTGHFYRCIADPTDADAICIDRHAHDIALGIRYGNHDRGLSSRGRYSLLASVYREAAARLGVIPQVTQAVTWVTWIAR